MAPIKFIKRARCVFHHAENKGDAQPPLRNAGGCPLQGERLCSHHRREDSEVRPHIRSATVLPGPRPVLQGCHMLQVRFAFWCGKSEICDEIFEKKKSNTIAYFLLLRSSTGLIAGAESQITEAMKRKMFWIKFCLCTSTKTLVNQDCDALMCLNCKCYCKIIITLIKKTLVWDSLRKQS